MYTVKTPDLKEIVYYIYYHRDPRPEYYRWKRYIGKGMGNRAYEVRNRSARHKKWLQCLRKNNLKPIVEIIEYFSVEKDAFDKERELIGKYRNLNYDLCNIHEGGLGGSTGPCLPETRDKISDTLKSKNFKLSPEHIKNIKEANSKRKMPEYQKEAIRKHNRERVWSIKSKEKSSKSKLGTIAWNKGIPRTDEFKEKMSENAKKFYINNPDSGTGKKILCHQNNTIYRSMSEAGLKLGICRRSIKLYLKNPDRKYNLNGYTFEYVV